MALDKKQIRKNRLDLEYHGESQKANAFLILLTTGILAFLGTFIWLLGEESFYFGLTITVVIFIIGASLYTKSSNRMNEILEELDEL